MGWLSIARAILTLIPAIIAAMKAIEAELPDKGEGPTKLAIIRGTLESAHEVGESTKDDFNVIWPAIEKTIGKIVSIFNDRGTFSEDPPDMLE